MNIEQVYERLRYQPHKILSFDIDEKRVTSYHNSKDNAIMMLIEMAKYSDHINLEFDVWSEGYKCELRLK